MSRRTKYFVFGGAGLIVLFVLAKLTGVVGGEEATMVDTAHVKRRTLSEQVSASGQLYPIEELKIAPDVAGEVVAIMVKEGQQVEKDLVLAKIRPDNFRNALQRQQAALEQTRAQLNRSISSLKGAEATFKTSEQDFLRNKRLYEDEVISKANYETAEARYFVDKQNVVSAQEQVASSGHQLTSAQASVREAKENLRLTTLRAPMSGRITRQLVKVGERVVGTQQMAGTTMFHIGDLSEMELRVNVIENDIVRLHMGDSAVLTVESYPDKVLKGVVTALATSANTKTSPEAVTEYEVRIQLVRDSYINLGEETNREDPLLPGMTASVEIITKTKEDVLSVPLAAVTIERKGRNRGGKGGRNNSGGNAQSANSPAASSKKKQAVVYVYAEGIAKIRKVKTAISTTDFVEITEGLKEGESIISGPFLVVTRRLKDNQAVEVKEKNGKGRGSKGGE